MKDKLKIDIGQLKGVKKGARATVFVMKYYVLIVIGYIVLYPLLYMLSNAFKGEKALVDVSLIWIPKYLSTEWFNEAFDHQLRRFSETHVFTSNIICGDRGNSLCRDCLRLCEIQFQGQKNCDGVSGALIYDTSAYVRYVACGQLQKP